MRSVEGTGKAHIIDGRVEHAVLLEIFTDVGIGTEIRSSEIPAVAQSVRANLMFAWKRATTRKRSARMQFTLVFQWKRI